MVALVSRRLRSTLWISRNVCGIQFLPQSREELVEAGEEDRVSDVVRRPLHHTRASRFICVFTIRKLERIVGESALHEHAGVRVDDDHLLKVVGQHSGAEQAGNAASGVSP
jgi:hypothetical protein